MRIGLTGVGRSTAAVGMAAGTAAGMAADMAAASLAAAARAGGTVVLGGERPPHHTAGSVVVARYAGAHAQANALALRPAPIAAPDPAASRWRLSA